MKEIETLPEESAKEILEKAEAKNFPSMNKPIHLGFDLKKISREKLYER